MFLLLLLLDTHSNASFLFDALALALVALLWIVLSMWLVVVGKFWD
jgi:hypothetical protein